MCGDDTHGREMRGDDTPGDTVDAFIGIGSNVGDRHAHVAHAFQALETLPLTSVIARSTVIETAPVGPQDQGPYLNAVVHISTRVAPRELLNQLLDIERQRGRNRARETRNGPRTLDMDLLLYGDWHVREEGLLVPHPRMHVRDFVMIPLAQIAPAVAASVRAKALH